MNSKSLIGIAAVVAAGFMALAPQAQGTMVPRTVYVEEFGYQT